MGNRTVEILNVTPEESHLLLKRLKDSMNNRYFVPFRISDDPRLKELAKLEYMQQQGVREESFEKDWPEFKVFLQSQPANRNILIPILDTGFMHDHPRLQGCIEQSVDFTGEGVEDLNGHGTVCALLVRENSLFKPRMLNIKVVESDGRGSPENLIKGIEWLIDFSKMHDVEIIANLSLGVYSKKWGLFRCKGECSICKAALKAANEGIAIIAAAGNTPGLISCPAVAGMNGDTLIVPVTTSSVISFREVD
ncbi:S8 family serine peptidase [Desulfobacterales bacterium HSG2]|nr:S8 family serine peptidase [Desulfobacterales bacterium HSG2]